MATALDIRPDVRVPVGSKWRLRRGDHKGAICVVEGQTWAGSIQYRAVERGNNQGNGKVDPSQMHTMPRSQFFGLYEPVTRTAADAASNGAVTVQPRFRQHNVPKKPVPAGQAAFPEPKGIAISVELITPELAKEWLERGGINRHRSDSRVDKLAAAILRGEWELTGDSIKLDAFGCVRDGQHRLQAIVQSGKTVQTLVVRNVEERAFDVMDTGKSRTVADVLSIHGKKSVFGLQAAVRNLMLLEHTGRLFDSTRESRNLITTVTALEYVNQHPEVEEGTRLGDTVRMVMAGGHGLWAAMLTLCLRVDRDAAYVFQDKLVNGEGLNRGDPILALRNRMLAEHRQFLTRNNNEKEELGATIIKAWNLWRRGQPVESWQKLKWSRTRDGTFPVAE